jgi:hypothetical protein
MGECRNWVGTRISAFGGEAAEGAMQALGRWRAAGNGNYQWGAFINSSSPRLGKYPSKQDDKCGDDCE